MENKDRNITFTFLSSKKAENDSTEISKDVKVYSIDLDNGITFQESYEKFKKFILDLNKRGRFYIKNVRSLIDIEGIDKYNEFVSKCKKILEETEKSIILFLSL